MTRYCQISQISSYLVHPNPSLDVDVRGGSAASVMRARRAFAPSPRRQRMSVLKLFFLCRTMYLISDMSKPVISDDFLTPQRPPPPAQRPATARGGGADLGSCILASCNNHLQSAALLCLFEG